jgi:glycosyltransferase involved in cell wall biosynthesis
MTKLRIGILIYDKSDPKIGGGHSYYDTLLRGINDFEFNTNIEIINIIFYSKKIADRHFKKPSIYIKSGRIDNLKRNIKNIASKYFNINLTSQHPLLHFSSSFSNSISNRRVGEILRKNKIDLIYNLKHDWQAFNYPFIATHWDNSHRSTQAFPEVALNGSYELREKYNVFTLNKAFLILCESQAGVTELRKYYSINDSKIKVLPLFAGNIINLQPTAQFESNTLQLFNLQKEKFFIYPAQFWALKNHYNLVIAFEKLIAENPDKDLKLLLCGTDHGNMTYIKQVIKSLQVEDHVIITGFVSDEQLNVFYRNALALTMTTFLGPTNMPLIEAAHLNCAVLCSNLEGHREIMGENASYFEPSDSGAIKDAMSKILDKSFRNNLVASAYTHIKQSPFNLEKSLIVLNKLLVDLIPLRKVWGINYKVE